MKYFVRISILFFLILLFSCKKKEIDELCTFFSNSTSDSLNLTFYYKGSSSNTSRIIAPNDYSIITNGGEIMEPLIALNTYYDSIYIFKKNICIIKFTKTGQYNYKGNPFINSNAWIDKGITHTTRASQTRIYIKRHDYWFYINRDSIITILR